MACNCQIYIPSRRASDTLRNHITIKGETKPSFLPTGGALDTLGSVTLTKGTSVLYSTLTTFAGAGAAIIGTEKPSGAGWIFNETFLTVENMSFRVKHNPSGTGPVVGAVNYKNGGGLNVYNSVAYIDTSGYASVLPQNDVTGFEGPDNFAETFNSFENVLAVGFRTGFEIAEHTTLVKTDAWCNYYAYDFKQGIHASAGLLIQSHWNAHDIYITDLCVLGNVYLDVEWQQSGKWFDYAAGVKDSANQAKGTIYYNIVTSSNLHNEYFVKSGGTNLNCYASTDHIMALNSNNTFTSKTAEVKLTTGAGGNMGLNLNAASGFNTFLTLANNNSPKWYWLNNGTGDPLNLLNSDANGNDQVISVSQAGTTTFNSQTTNNVASFNNASGSGNMVINYNSGSGTNTAVAYQNGGANKWYVGNLGSAGDDFFYTNSDANGNSIRFRLTQAGALTLSGYTAGTATFDGSGNITSSSDRRIKNSIKDFKGGLAEVLRLKPRTFIYNADKSNTVMSGFIAQEVQEVLPGAVHKANDKQGTLSLETNAILAAAINAIQEQQRQIDALKAEIKAMKN